MDFKSLITYLRKYFQILLEIASITILIVRHRKSGQTISFLFVYGSLKKGNRKKKYFCKIVRGLKFIWQ